MKIETKNLKLIMRLKDELFLTHEFLELETKYSKDGTLGLYITRGRQNECTRCEKFKKHHETERVSSGLSQDKSMIIFYSSIKHRKSKHRS